MLRVLRHWAGQPREVEDTPTGEMLELGWKGILTVRSVWVGLEGDAPFWKCWSWVGGNRNWAGRGYDIVGSVGIG